MTFLHNVVWCVLKHPSPKLIRVTTHYLGERNEQTYVLRSLAVTTAKAFSLKVTYRPNEHPHKPSPPEVLFFEKIDIHRLIAFRCNRSMSSAPVYFHWNHSQPQMLKHQRLLLEMDGRKSLSETNLFIRHGVLTKTSTQFRCGTAVCPTAEVRPSRSV